MKKIVPVVLLLAAVGAAAWYYFLRPRETDQLTLSGSIEARTVEVGSLVGGRVARVFIEEGDTVQAGQPLVAFEPDLRDLEIAEQRARIAEAGAALARTEAGPRDEETRRARIDWESAETDRKRFQTLFETGVIPRRDYETAQVRAAKALETLREAQRGGRQEDVAAARAALAREEQRLAFLERQREEMLVTAPTSGVVEVLDLRPGDLVAANQPVATILEPGQLWVRVYVPETELARVRIGQEARVFVDTYPGRPFRGRVVEVRDQGEYTPRNLQTLEQRSDQVFGVKVRIEPSPELKAGMAALVDLGPAAQPASGVRG
ncbi:MAG TPA: HlyD family efflux transporter periplasmic adaptor subunit [Thermoanaerobaculia bacterium]|nr:HlyD family efflux transporter periplasmic adaptor subunit [Thermoanaerobaculia bacterium]